MIDITHKRNTLRTAIAEATVKVGKIETIEAIEQGAVPKGDVLEASRVAGLFGVKQTSNIIPDCHPLPVEYASVKHSIDKDTLSIHIEMHVKTIYKTGVEVEAMHGASVVALTMYDMLKPIDKQVEIQNIRLLTKTGGKSDYLSKTNREFKAAVIVCSDTISKGHKEDKAGIVLKEKLAGFNVETSLYTIIPDEIEDIQNALINAQPVADVILFCGGTGLSPRDVTPQAVQPMLDIEIEGITETIRAYGMDRTPLAMLSRSVAGTYKDSLVITLPGSTKGASESVDAIFPHVLHVFKVFRGEQHD